jgi:hypothetical protein
VIPHPDDSVDLQSRWEQANPGEVIELRQPPIAVNVAVSGKPSELWPEQQQWTNAANPDKCAVIPLMLTLSNKSIIVRKRRAGPRGRTTKFGNQHRNNRLRFKSFQFDMGFAVTFYKAQGKTLKKVRL